MRHIIVDGYNVIRVDERLQLLERVSLEQARDVLVRTLASSPRLVGDRVTVVFDGARGPRPHMHATHQKGIEVVYSGGGQTADDVIVAEASRLAGTGRVIVVSNDADLRSRCLSAGCEVSGSQNLLRQMPGRAPAPSDEEDGESPPTLSTRKHGNPHRAPRKARRPRPVRF